MATVYNKEKSYFATTGNNDIFPLVKYHEIGVEAVSKEQLNLKIYTRDHPGLVEDYIHRYANRGATITLLDGTEVTGKAILDVLKVGAITVTTTIEFD